MAPRKRARTSSAGGSSSSSATTPTITLAGGEACPTKQVSLWRSGRLTDTTVEVDGRTFVAHRLVLAAACDYFERHYDHEHMRDADHPKLLEHVSAAAFEPLLSFLYEGACSFDESLLAPVLRAAHYLGVAPLERAAVVAFTKRLSPSNALTAWTWGEELKLPELADAAKETALEGFDEVEKIEDATLVQLQALVANDRLNAKSEEVVFSAVARFAEAKAPAEAELLGLLRNVRFPLMSKDYLLGTVRNSPMLQSTAGAHLLFEMMVPNDGPAQQPRKGVGGRFLYVLGGSPTDGSTVPLSTVEFYDTQADTWTTGTPLPSPRCNYASAVLGGKIYVLGGSDGHVIKTAWAFDPCTGVWAEVAPMAKPRRGFAAAVADGKLYVIGGIGSDSDILRSVEAFDLQTGAWAQVAPLTTPRCFTGAAVLGGKIYVPGGGARSNEKLSTVEVYDPQTNTWAAAPKMKRARKGHGVAALGGKMYVAGGKLVGGCTCSVEAFDPLTNSWSVVSSMKTTRYTLSLTAVRGKLYAAGGVADRGEDPLATVEAWDPQQASWEAVAPMAQARRYMAAICM